MNQISTTLEPSISLRDYGLADVDLPEIDVLAQKIQFNQVSTIVEFGREVSNHTSSYTDSLLSSVKNADLDDMGQQLSEVVLTAKKLDLNTLGGSRSRIPVIGKFIDKFNMGKEKFVQQFDSTKEQIDRLVHQIGATQQKLSKRVVEMDSMFESIKQEHHILGLHIAAGKIKHIELVTGIEDLKSSIGQTSLQVQEIADLEAAANMLDKRVGDLMALQQSALQSLPMVRMIQANNQMLVEKCHTIKELTVPAWKRQFMLALSLSEQRNAVELMENIDDATNQFLLQNADMLHKNAVSAAKSNQRLVIDIETLQKTQDTLIRTVEDVLKIRNDGVLKRKEAAEKLTVMRNDLQQKLVNLSASPIKQIH